MSFFHIEKEDIMGIGTFGLFRRVLVRTASALYGPLRIGIDGVGRNLLLKAGDRLWPRTSAAADTPVELKVGGVAVSLVVDRSHANERLLEYGGKQLVGTFRRSPLGRLIRETFRDGAGTFLDVGANLGVYSLLARAEGAATHLFEPEPRHADFLARNAPVFGVIHPVALSNRCGMASLRLGVSEKPGVSSLAGAADDAIYAGGVAVPVTTLDKIVGQAPSIDWADVRLIKVDVEGHETETMAGMQGLLRSLPNVCVWCEVRGPASGRGADSYVAVVEMMRALGFDAFWGAGRRLRPFAPRQGTALPQVFDLRFERPESGGYQTQSGCLPVASTKLL
ncbi:MAG: FkbM family methyltransferase [Myxococcota bacterium]